MMPLGLSYDHRVIDGAQAARFITDLVRAIEGVTDAEVALARG
jgi:pyruvate dehydrogenase E2 component (dihydrolipoamide acetyltransferase)